MKSWPVQDAKSRFSEMLDAVRLHGPQIVTRRGVETVAVVPIQEWNRLKASRVATLKDLLLEPAPRFNLGPLLPRRGRHVRRRPPVDFGPPVDFE